MTNNADAWIARMWASKALDNGLLDEVPIVGYQAAARHILATTTPPTMADVTEDEREACQWMQGRDESGDLLVIACVRREHCDVIYRDGVTTTAMHDQITPLPDLPRLKWPTSAPSTEDTPEPEDVPESTPDHPAVLTTEEDYRKAPKGTVVAMSAEAWTKTAENEWSDPTGRVDDKYMSSSARRVLRWGWKA